MIAEVSPHHPYPRHGDDEAHLPRPAWGHRRNRLKARFRHLIHSPSPANLLINECSSSKEPEHPRMIMASMSALICTDVRTHLHLPRKHLVAVQTTSDIDSSHHLRIRSTG